MIFPRICLKKKIQHYIRFQSIRCLCFFFSTDIENVCRDFNEISHLCSRRVDLILYSSTLSLSVSVSPFQLLTDNEHEYYDCICTDSEFLGFVVFYLIFIRVIFCENVKSFL